MSSLVLFTWSQPATCKGPRVLLCCMSPGTLLTHVAHLHCFCCQASVSYLRSTRISRRPFSNNCHTSSSVKGLHIAKAQRRSIGADSASSASSLDDESQRLQHKSTDAVLVVPAFYLDASVFRPLVVGLRRRGFNAALPPIRYENLALHW